MEEEGEEKGEGGGQEDFMSCMTPCSGGTGNAPLSS